MRTSQSPLPVTSCLPSLLKSSDVTVIFVRLELLRSEFVFMRTGIFVTLNKEEDLSGFQVPHTDLAVPRSGGNSEMQAFLNSRGGKNVILVAG